MMKYIYLELELQIVKYDWNIVSQNNRNIAFTDFFYFWFITVLKLIYYEINYFSNKYLLLRFPIILIP